MRKIKMGMVGGGRGAFIGGVHRMAAALDGQIELVCGAFSSDAAVSRATGADLFLSEARSYASFTDMILAEKQLPDGERMDFVSIVTPNHLHFAPAKMALENGFHVVCDKPVCFSLAEALILEKLVNETGLIFALTHNYTGYPMVKQARAMVEAGAFGALRKVIVEYPQGWLATRIEASNQRQAAWRTDPKKSGVVGAMGDIGTHAENLAEYVTGLKITHLCADLSALVAGRLLDDDATVLLEFDNGAKGVLIATQIAAGEENALRLRVYGEKGGLEWCHEDPNSLIVKWLDASKQILRTGVGNLSAAAVAHTRLPAGHPEGFLEAFANIYRNVARAIQAYLIGEQPDALYDFPRIEDGVRGMYFIERVVESAKSAEKWTNF